MEGAIQQVEGRPSVLERERAMSTPMSIAMPKHAHVAARHETTVNDYDDDDVMASSIPTSLRPGAQQQQSAIASYPPGASPPAVFSPAPPPPYAPYVPPAPMPRRASHSRIQNKVQPKPRLAMHSSHRPSGSSGFDERNVDGDADNVIENAYREEGKRRKGVGLTDGPHVVDCCAW